MKLDSRVCFLVTHSYLENSVKSLERKGRSNFAYWGWKCQDGTRCDPQQFGKFLLVAETKINLVKFLISDWPSNSKYSQVLNGKDLYFTIEHRTFTVSANANGPYKYPFAELSGQQEEADTKIFWCSQFVSQLGFGHVSIVIIDVVVLANAPSVKHTRRNLPRVWNFRRTGDLQRVWKQFGEGDGECSSWNTCY